MDYKIDKGYILTLASNKNVFLVGEKLYKQNQIKDIGILFQENMGLENVWAKFSESFNNAKVNLYFSDSGFLDKYSCTCGSSTIWKGACVHVIATLFALINAKDDNVYKAKTSANAQAIFRFFERQLQEDIEQLSELSNPYSEKATLKPILHSRENNRPYLTFQIGFQKMYILKNIQTFIENVKDENIVRYGKNLEFKHTISVFDDESKKLINFLIDFFTLFYEIKSITYSYGSGLSNNFYLLGTFLDNFFEIYKEKYIDIFAYSLSNISMNCYVTSQKPNIKFKLDYDEENIILKSEKFSFSYFHGENYTYMITEGYIHILENDYAKTLFPLIREINKSIYSEIIFPKEHNNKFLSFVLPRLKKLDLIDENSNLPNQILEETKVKKRVYLDFDKKHHITCTVLFCYDDNEINPLIRADLDIARNLYEEYQILSYIKSFGFYEETKNEYYILTDEEKIFDFYSTGVSGLTNIAEVYATDEFENSRVKPISKAAFGMRIQGNLLEINFDVDYSINELLEALNSYKAKKKYHKLKNGSFIDLQDKNIEAYEEILSSMDITKKDIKENSIILPKYRTLYLDEVIKEKEQAKLEADEKVKRLTDDFRNYKELDFEIPSGLNNTLRSYQKIGFKWLKTLSYYGFGGILADDMGLGKTIQVISVLLSEKNDNNKNPKPSIVVTPTSLIYNWEHEIQRFAPLLNITVLFGTPKKRKQIFDENKDNTDVFITTYDVLKRDIQNYDEIVFKYIVADEAQYIKNYKTQNAVAIKELKGESRFALTGTPIENALSELWSIFDFIMPGYLYNQSKFTKTYEAPIIKEDDKEKATQLQKQISPFILRRLKSDVLKELPDKVETTLYSQMEPEQRKIYMAHLLEARGELDTVIAKGAFEKNQLQILSQLTRLRQICCHPLTFMEDYSGGSGKLDLTIDTITAAIESGHKIILFSQFTSMLKILMEELKNRDFSFFYLDGATEAKLRKNMAEQFNNGEKDIFLISLKAGGTGLNLTGADVVIHYDQWWNPSVMNQATDRAHRYGQKNIVQVINIVTKDTIEEKILDLQNKKKDLIDSVIKEGASFINKLDVDDVKALFY